LEGRGLAVPVVVIVLLMTVVIGLQAVRERDPALSLRSANNDQLMYVQSPAVLERAVLPYRAFAADVYWIRAVQYFGSTNLSKDPHKTFDLLYPLLDITTTLDPKFKLAYRLGAIFLSEPFPGGPGRPDQAIALLEKGLKQDPRWDYAQDIGFVYYWWKQDYTTAAAWFQRAAAMPNAANWLPAVAALTLAEGGNRATARRLWQELARSDTGYLRRAAQYRLEQLDAMDQIDALQRAVAIYEQRTGMHPQNWFDLARAGLIGGTPRDPVGNPYRLNADSGAVTLDPASRLNPLPHVHPSPPVR
jgi:tetratricopeptide (TPR) repeat protein